MISKKHLTGWTLFSVRDSSACQTVISKRLQDMNRKLSGFIGILTISGGAALLPSSILNAETMMNLPAIHDHLPLQQNLLMSVCLSFATGLLVIIIGFVQSGSRYNENLRRTGIIIISLLGSLMLYVASSGEHWSSDVLLAGNRISAVLITSITLIIINSSFLVILESSRERSLAE